MKQKELVTVKMKSWEQRRNKSKIKANQRQERFMQMMISDLRKEKYEECYEKSVGNRQKKRETWVRQSFRENMRVFSIKEE